MSHHQHCTQVAVNSTLNIPENKPDVERILRVTSTPVITKTVVIDKKVIIAGHVLVFIEYVACVPGNNQPVHFVSFKVPFADFIEHPCAHPCMEAKLKIDLEFQEFHALSKRTITKLIILKICIVKLQDKTCQPSPHLCQPSAITPCPPDEEIPSLPPGGPCKHIPEGDDCHQHLPDHTYGPVPYEHSKKHVHHQCGQEQHQPKYCSICGSYLEADKGEFCIYCGKPL